eukprot:CAMPEP_0184338876 /NCGR_PEP_ID=MMETSP1089-20130417/7493_1 /TAXON_ID=38269 ORGANISM="Gloeochaete wittrockiana, Strain SAG46.84" /NCGR_SAMPLE_ID=MMETSP1089 /ASSEMBLY_ACC=CAM_ASM_000445 /LENGTH=234 /DNA_ID=CAMNT_0026665725 /DNA_START=31 /DNA_END=732 /DNA_ORIENTATION=-
MNLFQNNLLSNSFLAKDKSFNKLSGCVSVRLRVLSAAIEAGKEVDPFVSVKYFRGDCVFLKSKTAVVDSKTTPYWNHLIDFQVDGESFKSDDYLEFTLYDKDPLTNEFLGTVKVPMRGFKFGKYIEETIYVTGKAGMDRVPSSIRIGYFIESPKRPEEPAEIDTQLNAQEKQVAIFFGIFAASTFLLMIVSWLFGYDLLFAAAQLGACAFIVWKKVLQNVDVKDLELAKKCHDW